MKFERLKEIENILKINGSVSVNALSEKFGVSKETIRKDLDYLSSKKKIGRVHGGAYSFEYNKSVPYHARDKMLVDEKKKIASLAAEFIKDGDTLFVDSSTTSITVVKKLLSDGKKLKVITNSLACADIALKNNNIDLYTIGGSLNKNNISFETQNSEIYNFYNADYAVISPSGIDIKCGITDKSACSAKMLSVFIARAKHTLIVADHTKLNSVSTFAVSPLCNVDGIITDRIYVKESWINASHKDSFFIKEIQTANKE